MPWGVPTSLQLNFYPLEFPWLFRFGAPPHSAGCSLLAGQPWAPARAPWQGAAPTPLLPMPAHDGHCWFVRHMHAWVPGGWESHSLHLKGWSTTFLPFTLTQTCLQRGPLLQSRWSGSWPVSKGTSHGHLKMVVVPLPQSAPLSATFEKLLLVSWESADLCM